MFHNIIRKKTINKSIIIILWRKTNMNISINKDKRSKKPAINSIGWLKLEYRKSAYTITFARNNDAETTHYLLEKKMQKMKQNLYGIN